MKAVKITWIDSCCSDVNWTFFDEVDTNPILIHSVGFIIKETESYVSIAQNYGTKPKQFCNVITIPKGCIEEITTLFEIEEKLENKE